MAYYFTTCNRLHTFHLSRFDTTVTVRRFMWEIFAYFRCKYVTTNGKHFAVQVERKVTMVNEWKQYNRFYDCIISRCAFHQKLVHFSRALHSIFDHVPHFVASSFPHVLVVDQDIGHGRHRYGRHDENTRRKLSKDTKNLCNPFAVGNLLSSLPLQIFNLHSSWQ